MAKGKKPPKTPAYKKASPNNPRNNAGPKIKSSSAGPKTSEFDRPTRYTDAKVQKTNVFKAAQRAADRSFMTNSDKSHMPKTAQASRGMARKNTQKAAEVGLKRMTSPTNPKVSSGTNAYTKYNDRTSQLGKRSPSMLAKAGSKAGSVARFAGAVARGANVAGAVVLAGQAGWQIGSEIYSRNATAIQDAIGGRQKNYSDRRSVTKKIKRK